MSKLSVGINVDIQRTNGLIHKAVVVNIDWKSQNARVEWCECEEIKAKEIDFDSIFLLNTNLCEPINQSIRPNIITAPSSRGSLSAKPSNNRQTIAKGKSGAIDPLPVVSSSLVTRPSSSISNVANKSVVIQASSRRRSNVVKEVEKLNKKSDEKRAQQKVKKTELMNAVTNQSQWEFLQLIREYRAGLECKPITLNDVSGVHQICVAVRKRPFNKREIQRKDIDVITIPNKGLTIVHEPKQKVDLTRYLENHLFRFDYAFDELADNELVYKYTAKPLVQTIFDGGMATCFAYGQTGSGKTHTMGGNFDGKSQDSSKGIYALAAMDVFKLLRSSKYRREDISVFASFFEIYSGKVFDLLNGKTKLRVLEDANQQVQVVGLQEKSVDSVEDVLELIQMGNNIRTSGKTAANSHSSRSHAVFQLILKQQKGRLRGKFSLIDLAGNERGADTASYTNRESLIEGAEINKSLLALKECIRALGRKSSHLPFRTSKLTQVLRDSFIGENSRTCMIAMISPSMLTCEHTLNTLRYADRVKELMIRAYNPDIKSSDENMSDSDECLSILHNSDSDELPNDLYTIHEAVSHNEEMEDEVIILHKTVIDNYSAWNQRYVSLLQMASEVDYDIDAYVQHSEELLDDNIDFLIKLKEQVTNFRTQLNKKEKLNKTFG